jgi:hypothetical protein
MAEERVLVEYDELGNISNIYIYPKPSVYWTQRIKEGK